MKQSLLDTPDEVFPFPSQRSLPNLRGWGVQSNLGEEESLFPVPSGQGSEVGAGLQASISSACTNRTINRQWLTRWNLEQEGKTPLHLAAQVKPQTPNPKPYPKTQAPVSKHGNQNPRTYTLNPKRSTPLNPKP